MPEKATLLPPGATYAQAQADFSLFWFVVPQLFQASICCMSLAAAGHVMYASNQIEADSQMEGDTAVRAN